ncbi:MAG: FHA domain-containing protein, partial [Planctomycetota bacterium]
MAGHRLVPRRGLDPGVGGRPRGPGRCAAGRYPGHRGGERALSSSATATLEVLSGELSGRTYAIDEEEFVIGRSQRCHLVIPKRYVSREHARIVREGSDYIVDGLSEKNPVHVGARPIREHLLSDGDVFEFCGIRFRFRRPRAGAARNPSPRPAPAGARRRPASPRASWR